MKQKNFINEASMINTILLSLMIFVLIVVIVFVTPLSDPYIKFAFSILFGILISFIANRIISLSARLRKVEIHDELTGLYNNNFLSECKYRTISTSDRQQAKLGIMTISIERLQDIENLFGTKASEAVIRFVGEGISITSRATEYIFRIQDDDFLIFFADINEYNNIKVIKSRLNTFFEKPFVFNSEEIYVKLAFGYAVYPDDGEDFDSVLNVAKQRMYVEKSRQYN
jgi:diguanylate cyclase (GGDEF)-like protein